MVFGPAGTVNSLLNFLSPSLGNLVGCTPRMPDQTDPNSYSGAWTYMNATANAPGAPQKQPCLKSAGTGQCRTDTNTYATTRWVPNRFEHAVLFVIFLYVYNNHFLPDSRAPLPMAQIQNCENCYGIESV
jgi:hypothetical protein